MDEIWLPVPGWDAYEASSLGRIRRSRTSKGARSGRILTGHPNNRGYTLIHLRQDGRVLMTVAHILVAAAFHGPCPLGYEVNHKDTVKTHNEPDNLEYMTRSENMRHCYAMGCRQPIRSQIQGQRNKRAKLTDELVRQLRLRYAAGASAPEMAAELCLSPSTVYEAATRRTWTHIT